MFWLSSTVEREGCPSQLLRCSGWRRPHPALALNTAFSNKGMPPVQRVVTGHDAKGRAIFVSEDVAPTRMIPSGDAAFLLMRATTIAKPA